MKTVSINLFSFNELNEKAQEKAILEHSDFLGSVPVEVENENGEMEEIYEDYSKEDVIDNILSNKYIFFEDGTLAHCTT